MLSKLEVSTRARHDRLHPPTRATPARTHALRRGQPRCRRRDAPPHRARGERSRARARHSHPTKPDDALPSRSAASDRHAEAHHDARGVRWIEDLGQDVRYAARSLRRSAGFTITAVLVLALGIGASTAIFSAVDHVLVSRLPYPNDDRLVRIYPAELTDEPVWPLDRRLPARSAISSAASPRSEQRDGERRRWPSGLTCGAAASPPSTPVSSPPSAHARHTAGSSGAADVAPDQLVAVVTHDFAVREFGGDGSGAVGQDGHDRRRRA